MEIPFFFTHNLDFDDSLVLDPQNSEWDSDEDDDTSHFMNFVDRYIMLSNVAHINKFRLKCRKNLDISRVNTWICAALVRNVRELDLCFPAWGKPWKLPHCVFTCSTLVVLKLGMRFSLNVPASVYLPRLNSLHLHSIEFPDDISTQRLFSSCPALEDLAVTGCSMEASLLPCCVFTCSTLVVLKLGAGFFLNVPASVYLPCLKSLHLDSIQFPDDISIQRLFSSCPALEDLAVTGYSPMENIQVFNLSSPTLKRLTLNGHWRLALDAPRLIYLKFTGCCKVGSIFRNLNSLFEAHMYFYGEYGEVQTHLVLEVVKGINCVRSLYLSDFDGMDFQTISAELPLFENLTYLNLHYEQHYEWFMLLKLLHCSPNLEELIFYELLLELSDFDDWDEEEANNNVPSCLSHHLKVIEFKICGAGGVANLQCDLWRVEYFMKNAEVLETVRIQISGHICEQLDIAKKLLMIPRLSKTCKVEIY